MKAMGLKSGTCVLDFDIIAFPINIDNMHWVTAWLDTRTRSVTVVDSMDTSKVLAAACVHVSGNSLES